MANEITLTVTMSATSPDSISVAHSVSGKQFDQSSVPPQKDVFKESVEFSTSYLPIPMGDCAYANKTLLLITNRSPTANHYMFISLNAGANDHIRLPPNGTAVLWPDLTLTTTSGAAGSIKAKFAGANGIAEITCVESAV